MKEITIAAWLHDVGKFAQRAERNELYDKQLEGQFCKPQNGGWYSHQHVVYTAGFLEKFKDVIPDGINVYDVRRMAASHHNPSSYDEWLVAQGDRLSSGADRCKLLQDVDEGDNPVKFYEKPMLHILSTLHIEGRGKTSGAHCSMRPLAEDAILSSSNNKIGKDDYNRLWNLFEADFLKLKGLDYNDFMQALNSLLERYWWCIPSATNSDADISLYQHSKTTAAFAATLHAWHKENGMETETALKDESAKKFRFLKGDISGIQKYIFDIKTSDDNAKLLRAKSFQLSALSDILAQYIVGQFGMPSANIITSAGGNFMLLLPNTQKAMELIPQLQLEIETYFLNEFAGKLAVIISDGIEASAYDVSQKNAQKLINDIGYNADICKQKKMQKALQKHGAILDGFYAELQKNGECPKCGVFPSVGTDTDGHALPCKSCDKLTEIGAQLVRSASLVYKAEQLGHFGDMVKVSRKESVPHSASINTYVPGRPLAYMPYTAPRKDTQNNDLLTFSDIAMLATGNKKLAMFKADIDNLGLIFSSSLSERMSFSRYADMSHMLHYFFSAFYTWFLQNHTYTKLVYEDGKRQETKVKYADTIYTVFSGGDDLCILGAWDAVMHFALDFQKELVKLTNGNPSLSISGGIVLASPSVPAYMIAASAEEELENSKGRMESGKVVKNAITVFGTTVSWEEYEQCMNDGILLQECLSENKLPTGVVYKMIDFARRAEAVQQGDVSELLDMRNHLWKSNFRYVLRNVKNDAKGEIRNKLLEFATSAEKMIKSRIAVSYALYTQRKS